MLFILIVLDNKNFISRKFACLMAIYVLSLDFTSFKFVQFSGKNIEYVDESPYIPRRLLFVVAYCLARCIKNEKQRQKAQ